MRKLMVATLALFLPSGAIGQNALCTKVEGAIVVSDDGKYLGKITNKYNSDSIFNKYGTYGSKYGSDSIWNKYGSYGSPYNNQSVASIYTSTPPMMLKDRNVIGYLSKNKNKSGVIDPLILGILCYDFEPE